MNFKFIIFEIKCIYGSNNELYSYKSIVYIISLQIVFTIG